MKKIKELKVVENPQWSPSRLAVADRCMKGYWFQYIFHLKHTISSNIAMGKLEHKMIENFWKEDPDTGLLVQGYKSYQSFVNSAVRDWKFYYVRSGEVDGQKIEWSEYDGNGYSSWLIGRIAETAGIIYTRYVNEEPRLKAEVKMEGEFDEIKIMAIADELRKDLVIRDHKSGHKKIGEYFVQNNIQMTLCLMCLFNCLQSPYTTVIPKIYPEYKGIPLDEFLDISKIEIHDISPRWTKDRIHQPITKIYSAKRTEQDFNEVIEAIESKQKAIKERDFHPSKDNCDYCFYNHHCNKYDPVKYHENEYERNFPLFANAGVFIDSCNPKIVKKRRQKIFRFK